MINPFRKFTLFLREVVEELKKASWPSRQEMISSTMVVIAAILLLGAYVSIVDFSVYQVVRLLIALVHS